MFRSARPVCSLFVYGTLLPDLAPPEIRLAVKQLENLGPARLTGARLYDLHEYPAAVPAGGREVVYGRVFRLPRNPQVLLGALDVYEEATGFPTRSLFTRRVRKVRLKDGRHVRAWVYFYNRPLGRAPLLARGRYKRPNVLERPRPLSPSS